MANSAGSGDQCVCDGFWCVLVELYDRGGVGVLAFLILAFVFYRMVWKVWTTAMESKDREIERLIDERNFYQKQILPSRLTSNEDSDSRT